MWKGTIRGTRNKINKIFLPEKEILAKAYPAREVTPITQDIVAMLTITLFKK